MPNSKPKIGRPLQGLEPRLYTIGVRVSKREKRQLERAAKRQKCSLAAFLRDLALAAE